MIRFTNYEEQIIETYTAVSDHFRDRPGTIKFPAVELMPRLFELNVFPNTYEERSPVEDLLDLMNRNDHISILPWAIGEGDPERLKWSFVFLEGSSLKELEEKMADEQTSRFVELGDENYLLDLCDEILDQKALRQHKFNFLGEGRNLPFLGFYPNLNLALYYQKPPQSEVVTRLENINWISGRSLHREKEEEEFLQRCRELLSEKGIQHLEIHHSIFSYNKLKRMNRNLQKDKLTLENLIGKGL